MLVNPVSSAGIATLQASQSGPIRPARQLKQDFDAVGQALGANDLGAAQKAFAALQQDLKNLQQAQAAQPASAVGQGNPQDALSALSQALVSGDLSGAQNAFSTLVQDLQGQAGAAHHHGHHHGRAGESQASGTAINTTA